MSDAAGLNWGMHPDGAGTADGRAVAAAVLEVAYEARTANLFRRLAVVERVNGKSSPQWLRLWSAICDRLEDGA